MYFGSRQKQIGNLMTTEQIDALDNVNNKSDNFLFKRYKSAIELDCVCGSALKIQNMKYKKVKFFIARWQGQHSWCLKSNQVDTLMSSPSKIETTNVDHTIYKNKYE